MDYYDLVEEGKPVYDLEKRCKRIVLLDQINYGKQ
jgi:hypothetical protein